MLMLVLTWIGIVLATTLLLLMALGPVIVELDSLLERRRRDRRQAGSAAPVAKVAPRPVLHG